MLRVTRLFTYLGIVSFTYVMVFSYYKWLISILFHLNPFASGRLIESVDNWLQFVYTYVKTIPHKRLYPICDINLLFVALSSSRILSILPFTSHKHESCFFWSELISRVRDMRHWLWVKFQNVFLCHLIVYSPWPIHYTKIVLVHRV